MIYFEGTTESMIFEATITVNQLCVRLLFNGIPGVEDLIEATGIVFADKTHIAEGMEKILTNIADDMVSFQEGAEIQFTEDDKVIGSIVLQTRTLFEI